MSKFRLKFLFFLLIPVFLFWLLPSVVEAQGNEGIDFEALDALPGLGGSGGTAGADVACQELASEIIANCLPTPNGYDCTPAFFAKTKSDAVLSKCQDVTAVLENLKKIAADKLLAQAEKTFFQSIAGAWKSMLNQFAKQFAYDTATWIASGGKGQKPLFITEGVGAYLKNTADNAAGTFIDEIDQHYGLDLCRPNFNVELMIKTSLTGYRPNKVSCNFTGMVRNWRTAIKDARFSVEYSNYLKAGENDIGIYLKTSSGLMDKVNQKSSESIVEAIMNNGYKDLKTLTGWVLTPGTMIREEYSLSKAGSNKANESYTGTAWDFIETFLNTLVGQLLQNLKDGYFKSGGSDSGGGFNLPDLSRFSALLNPESAPYIDGSQGAQDRFLNLIEGDVKTGGPYDILIKLLSCTEANKTNPGPTDCVVDPILAQAIRDKKLVKDLPASILNRQFVPPLSNVNPQESFSLRNIVILRKYRIVPVGWEIAARYISQSGQAQKNYTLSDLLKEFNNSSSDFYKLVDPQWVLKAPELYCRREGYGDHNVLASEQNKGIRRDTYCADEQQCINEDADGNCVAYGYCTEERKSWNLQSPKCEPRFNTCQTFQSQNGATGSYLANTLDYQNCSAQTAGCRWYSTFYNPQNSVWTNVESQEVLKSCTNPLGCSVDGAGLVVPQWQQTKYATNNSKGVVMASVCTTTGGCAYSSADSCTISYGGVQCSLDRCLNPNNVLASLNGDFEDVGRASWDARLWEESYQNETNRQFRSNADSHSDSNSLQSLSFNNINPLQSKLTINAGIESLKNYKLSFWVRGSISQGSIDVKVFAGTQEVGSQTVGFSSENWREYFVYFTTPDLTAGYEVDIRVITAAGTTGSLFFDDFDLREIQSACASGDVFLNLGSQDAENSEIYFDRDVQTCSSSAVGCSQFIRTKAGLGSNLIVDSSFEGMYSNLANWQKVFGSEFCAQSLISSGIDGEKSIGLKLDPPAVERQGFNLPYACLYSVDIDGHNSNTPFPLPSLKLISGQKYVLSGRIYAQKTGKYFIGLRNVIIESSPSIFNEADLYKWTTVSVSFVAATNEVISPSLRLVSNSGDDISPKEAYFDAVKLETVLPEVSLPSAYTDYSPDKRPASQLTYLKKAPAYYNCYDSDLNTAGIQWPTDLPSLQSVIINRNPACANYSSVCIESEMNCELYTPVNGDPAVPGTITSADVCPSECAGYQVYKQEATSFVSSKYEQFINRAPIQACSASAVGCDEFTNLDEVERGGEALEYYTQFRVCQKPDVYNDDRTYYTWEGSDTTGYQLRVFKLKRSGPDGYDRLTAEEYVNLDAPCTNLAYNNDGTNVCADPSPSNITDSSSYLYNSGACSASDLNSNPDCREFYDTNGNVHYRLLSRVIYVDDNCHPYRRTQTQNDDIEAASDCRANQGYWNNLNECIYMAIPQQGQTCSADLVGCREYTGNRGNSFRNIFLSDFESGAMGWQGGTIGAEATHPGGNSLTNVINQLSKSVLVKNGKLYALSFWAKGGDNFRLDSIQFSDAPTKDSFLIGRPEEVGPEDIKIPITSNWNRYDLGPVQVNWSETTSYFEQNLEINIPAGKTIYIDNVLLKELPQSVYAIENSWFTPFTCDNNLNEPYGEGDALNPIRSNPGKMIGCQEYRDRSNKNWFLKSFENLCRADAVGCEQLIDTYNSTVFNGGTVNEDNDAEITVPADEFVYMVNDAKYGCKSDDQGCSALGLPNINSQNEVVGYTTAYLKNQPDRYPTDLCPAESLWCEEFIGSRNVSYFKNPRDRVCEYRIEAGQTQAQWYQKGSNQLCDLTYLQTLGTGAKDAKVQPVGWFNSYGIPSEDQWFNPSGDMVGYEGWVGMCPTDQNSCTEYIDPSAEVYKNEILNANLLQDAGGDGTPDHWVGSSSVYSQELSLLTHTLYSFATPDIAGSQAYIKLTSACGGRIVSPDVSMNIEENGKKVTPQSTAGRFYIIDNSNTCKVTLYLPSQPSPPLENLRLVQAGVYYALSSKVDYTSCNGLVDYNAGCVLFNDRGSINYYSDEAIERNANYLTFDADATYKEQLRDSSQRPLPPQSVVAPNTGDSNVILKVQPDRACYSWLYCTTYEKDDPNSTDPIYGNNDKCLDLGLCASVDEKGVCNNFILKTGEPAVDLYDENDINKTGYALVGKTDLAVPGYFPYYQMTQFGNAGNITNGSFESLVGGSTEPIGWSPSESTGENTEDYKSEAIGWHDYKFSVGQDTKNSPEGSRYLRLNSFYEALSEEIDVFENSKYILSGWINSAGLNYPDPNVKIKSQIQYSQHIDGGSWGSWYILENLSLDSGLAWTKKTHEFTTRAGVDKVKIRLKNYVADNNGSIVGCDDNNKITPCELGGASYFDDISLKPVLTVSDSPSLLDKYVSRSCRIYPAEDSLSCRYLSNNNLYYGSYGYCLLVDPANAKQCLQWWPVDQLQGEILNEVGGYNDRVPLDYCVDKQRFNINFSEFGNTMYLSSEAQEEVGQFFDSSSNSQTNFTPINIKDDYRPLFRFPYVEKINLKAFGIGVVGQGTGVAIMIPVFHDITYDIDAGEWGGWAALPVCVGADGILICIPMPIPYEIAVGNGGTLLSAITTYITTMTGGQGFGFGPLMGLKIIDDHQMGGVTSGGVSDPIPDLPGDILGASWFVKTVAEADAVAIGMSVSGNFDVNYCDRLVRVVNSSGENKAYANRVTKGSGYINSDVLARPGGTAGKYYYYDPFSYDQFLDSFSAAVDYTGSTVLGGGGEGNSGRDRLLTGVGSLIGWINNNTNLNIPPFITNFLNPGGNSSLLDSSSYQSSDYQPFGAIVSPPGSPNPVNWSSRQGIYNTPLLYEPPRLGGFQPPYQARMGEVHSSDGLKQLFAQSYGEWEWVWNKDGSPERGGYYRKMNNDIDFLSIPNTLCLDQNAPRPATGNPCYIKPKIPTVQINGENNPAIYDSIGLAKLAFSTRIDPDQLPITAYTIEWGDGEFSNVSGVSLRNRTNPLNPFLLYHLYDFWKVKSVNTNVCNATASNVPCCSDDFCKVNVGIKIYDNWNKSNDARSIPLIISKNPKSATP